MLALDIAWDVVHWAWTVKRHDGDDVLEGVGTHAFKHIAHASTFQLKYTGRFAVPNHFKSHGVVEWDGSEIENLP